MCSRPTYKPHSVPAKQGMVIYLGRMLPHASSGIPDAGRAALLHLLCLAPGGVYPAAPITEHTGGLLHHPFTLTPGNAGCGLLSVALSIGFLRPAVSRHRALWSTDFPRTTERQSTM